MSVDLGRQNSMLKPQPLGPAKESSLPTTLPEVANLKPGNLFRTAASCPPQLRHGKALTSSTRDTAAPPAAARRAQQHRHAKGDGQRERQWVDGAGHHGDGKCLVELCLGSVVIPAGRGPGRRRRCWPRRGPGLLVGGGGSGSERRPIAGVRAHRHSREVGAPWTGVGRVLPARKRGHGGEILS